MKLVTILNDNEWYGSIKINANGEKKYFYASNYEHGHDEMYNDILERYGNDAKVTGYETYNDDTHIELNIESSIQDCNKNRRTFHSVYIRWSRRIDFYGEPNDPSKDSTYYAQKAYQMVKDGTIIIDNLADFDFAEVDVIETW